MNYYLAPMEGITTYLFRNAFHRHFGGACKYFTPFLSNRGLSSRERNDVLPEHNTDIPLIPQILTNRSEEFLAVAKRLADYGYRTVNLNLGCPSPTVTSRKRGSGFLEDPEELDRFLDDIYTGCPLKISLKTRIGIADPAEWERLLSVYQKYPLEELIIHPRLQKEGYRGVPHYEAYGMAEERLSVPLCYNGDIVSAASRDMLLRKFPKVSAIMIGRGALKNPDLIRSLQAGCKPAPSRGEMLKKLRAFHDEILEGYCEIMSGDQPTLFKMKDLWTYLGTGFEPSDSSDKLLKKIRKANRIADYRNAVTEFFETQTPVG